MISKTSRRRNNRNVTVTLLLQVLCISYNDIFESPRLRGRRMPSADRKNTPQKRPWQRCWVNSRRRQPKSGHSSGKVLPSSPCVRITGIAWPPGNLAAGRLRGSPGRVPILCRTSPGAGGRSPPIPGTCRGLSLSSRVGYGPTFLPPQTWAASGLRSLKLPLTFRVRAPRGVLIPWRRLRRRRSLFGRNYQGGRGRRADRIGLRCVLRHHCG